MTKNTKSPYIAPDMCSELICPEDNVLVTSYFMDEPEGFGRETGEW